MSEESFNKQEYDSLIKLKKQTEKKIVEYYTKFKLKKK